MNKSRIFVLLAAIATALSLSACSDDDSAKGCEVEDSFKHYCVELEDGWQGDCTNGKTLDNCPSSNKVCVYNDVDAKIYIYTEEFKSNDCSYFRSWLSI